MTVRTYTQKDGTIWEWDETQQIANYIKNLHNSYGNTDGGTQSSKSKEQAD